MWPDRVSNPGLLTYESGALPTALRGPAAKGKRLPKHLSKCQYPVEVFYSTKKEVLRECIYLKASMFGTDRLNAECRP